jgi:hypothetical protein
MSHSYRKTPVLGCRPTEKEVKRVINRQFRRKAKPLLNNLAVAEKDELHLPEKLREVSNDRDMPKAPRGYCEWLAPKSKQMRK